MATRYSMAREEWMACIEDDCDELFQHQKARHMAAVN